MLCMKDSVAVKAAVEDGVMTKPPSTWRDLHAEEMVKREVCCFPPLISLPYARKAYQKLLP